MSSTKRLLLILIAINLLTGIALDIHQNARGYKESTLTQNVLIGEQYDAWLRNQDATQTSRPSTTTQLEENTYGSSLTGSWRLFSIFYHGLHPYPFQSGAFNNAVENLILIVLTFFKSVMYMIIGLELYVLVKNKKTD